MKRTLRSQLYRASRDAANLRAARRGAASARLPARQHWSEWYGNKCRRSTYDSTSRK